MTFFRYTWRRLSGGDHGAFRHIVPPGLAETESDTVQLKDHVFWHLSGLGNVLFSPEGYFVANIRASL